VEVNLHLFIIVALYRHKRSMFRQLYSLVKGSLLGRKVSGCGAEKDSVSVGNSAVIMVIENVYVCIIL